MSLTSYNTGYLPWNRSKNPLLLKDDVGRPKPSAYNLPQLSNTYGKPLERDEEGAKEVSMTWKYHQETRMKEPDRDFAKLNKMSLNYGLHKANDVSNFRKQNDARLAVKQGKNALPLFIPEDEFRYGIPNRPSTPMNLVVSNSYGLEYQQHLESEYLWRSQAIVIPKGNKASDLSYIFNKEKLSLDTKHQDKELFKLTKFKKVVPRTNTNLKKERVQTLPVLDAQEQEQPLDQAVE